MSVTTTTRLGVTQWSAGTDPYNRAQLNSSFASLEGKAAGFLQGTVRPAAAPANQGYLFFNTSGNALSYSDGAAWWEIVAGNGNFGSPIALTIGATASDGVATTAARADHRHAGPGFGTAVSIGTTNTAGTGETVARANHQHVIGVGAINSSDMFAPGILGSASIENGSITTGKLADLSVTTDKIANGAVTAGKMDTLAVATGTIQDLAVTDAKIATGISGSKVGSGIAAGNITTGTVAIARLPTGTTSSTVSLGNHTHSGVYVPVAHTNSGDHDERYYTESEVNSLLAGKSSTSHNHTGTYLSDNGGTLTGSLTITGSLGVGNDMSNTGAPGTTNAGLASWRQGTGLAFWAFTSSRSYKEDIQDAPESYAEKVLQLNPRTFRSKHKADEGKTLLGLIAEEVYEILPEFTSGYDSKTGRVESISLDGLVVPLLIAVKKLSGELQSVKEKLSTLEA